MPPEAPVSCPRPVVPQEHPVKCQWLQFLLYWQRPVYQQSQVHEVVGLELVFFVALFLRGWLRVAGSIVTAKAAGPQTGQRDASASSLLLYHKGPWGLTLSPFPRHLFSWALDPGCQNCAPFLARWTLTAHFTSLSLSFLICETGTK